MNIATKSRDAGEGAEGAEGTEGTEGSKCPSYLLFEGGGSKSALF